MIYCRAMQNSDWDRLANPFRTEEVTWRIRELAPDKRSARVEPQLTVEAIVARLDEVVGRPGWSFRYTSFGNAVGCELIVDGVARSAVVEPVRSGEGPEECSRAAFASSAALFGMRPPAGLPETDWVDYDPDEDTALTPEVVHAVAPSGGTDPGPSPVTESREQVKPEGQQAIDRLVERLKSEGSGLEAARLLVKYGGYGSDPEAARELYGKLRELLSARAGTAK